MRKLNAVSPQQIGAEVQGVASAGVAEVVIGQGAGRHAGRRDPWVDDEDAVGEPVVHRLTADEARVLVARQVRVSPWRVIAAQLLLGVCLAGLTGLTSRGASGAMSVLYGALVVVIPGALMARGMTSRLSVISPTLSAVSFLGWELVKIAVSVAMLMLAPRLVQPLDWLFMLLAMAACMKVYWVALVWRGGRKS